MSAPDNAPEVGDTSVSFPDVLEALAELESTVGVQTVAVPADDDVATALDLIHLVEEALRDVVRLGLDPAVVTVEEVVDTVERRLPAGFPLGETGPERAYRRDLIAQVVELALTGYLYSSGQPVIYPNDGRGNN